MTYEHILNVMHPILKTRRMRSLLQRALRANPIRAVPPHQPKWIVEKAAIRETTKNAVIFAAEADSAEQRFRGHYQMRRRRCGGGAQGAVAAGAETEVR